MMVWAGLEGCAEVALVPEAKIYVVEESMRIARETVLRNSPRVSSSRAQGWRVEVEKLGSLLEDILRIEESDQDSSDSGNEAEGGGFRFVADILRSKSPSSLLGWT